MSRTFSIALLLLIQLYSKAQDVNSKTFLNVSVNYYSQNETKSNDSLADKNEESGGTVTLNVGHYFTNKFAAGIVVTSTKNNLKSTEFDIVDGYFAEKINASYYSTGAFERYNYIIKDEKLGFFFQLNELFNLGKERYTATQRGSNVLREKYTTRTYGATLSLIPGVLYFITNKFSIEASIGNAYYDYSIAIPDQSSSIKTKTSDASLNFSLRAIILGVSYYFGGKKI
jgi:hypothetical protein